MSSKEGKERESLEVDNFIIVKTVVEGLQTNR